MLPADLDPRKYAYGRLLQDISRHVRDDAEAAAAAAAIAGARAAAQTALVRRACDCATCGGRGGVPRCVRRVTLAGGPGGRGGPHRDCDAAAWARGCATGAVQQRVPEGTGVTAAAAPHTHATRAHTK